MRIILLGPTASGKTELSLLIAEDLDIPIISVDSRQCYKHVDIGTAKPSKAELKKIQHYNISNLDLDEPDSVQAFSERVESWEKDILKDHPHSFFVGGSTLHLQSLIQPVEDLPSANAKNVSLLNRQAETEGIEPLYKKLKEADPDYTLRMDGMNRQRIIRALDVWMQTGRPFSSFHSGLTIKPDENTIVFGITRSREALYKRINHRVDKMIESGLVDETKSILEMGYSKQTQALNAVGYREIINYLEKVYDLNTAISKIKTQSRRYAKRQFTWFKRWEFTEWLDADSKNPEELKEIILSGLAAKLDKH